MTNQTIYAPNNRLTLVNGNLVMINGLQGLQQSALEYMQTLLGELIYQPQDGVPYLSAIWQQENFPQWEAAARTRLMQVPGVVSVQSLTYSVNGDVFSYVATLQTIYSPALLAVSDTITQ